MKLLKSQIYMLIIDALIVSFLFGLGVNYPKEKKENSISDNSIEVSYLDDFEEDMTRLYILKTLGTENEVESFGYPFSKVVSIVYSESGGDTELAKMICTCIINTQRNNNWKITPYDVCANYLYSDMDKYYSSEILLICLDVLLDGNVNTDIGNATVFTIPNHANETATASELNYIYSYNCAFGEVKFYESVEG